MYDTKTASIIASAMRTIAAMRAEARRGGCVQGGVQGKREVHEALR